MREKTGLWWLLAVVCVAAFCLMLLLVNLGPRKEEPSEPGPRAEERAGEAVLDLEAEERAEESVFNLEEVSVFELEGPYKQRLMWGQFAEQCGDKPNEQVKAYPRLRSEKAVYGMVTLGMSFFQPGSGLRYCFAVDESGGMDAGYDRLYFDTDHDFDLTNDPVLGPMKDLPSGAEHFEHAKTDVFFEYLQFNLDYGPGEGSWPVKIIPRFMSYDGGHRQMTFLVPAARKGRISIGSKEYEALLAQSPIVAGRFDRPTTSLFLGEGRELMPFLCFMRYEDGTLYGLSATPAGDKLTVTGYKGAFGVFDVGAGGRDVDDAKLEFGWLQSEEAIIDIDKCPKEGGKLKLPVGDYRPFRLGVRLGQLRVGVAANISLPGGCGEMEEKPAVFGIKIREDKPFVFDFSNPIKVDFKNPTASQRIKLGEELKVEAIVYDPVMDILIAGLEDTSQKIGEPIDIGDGRKLQQYQRLDPVVKISNSSGECVAEGKMPFG